MVRFFGGKVTVKLSATNLENTASTLAETSRGVKQRSHIEQYTLQSVEGLQDEFVPERYIRDPEDGMSTHFLGKNKHIPFLMAEAGYNIVNETPSETRKIRFMRIPLEHSDEGRKSKPHILLTYSAADRREGGTRTVTYTTLNRERVCTPPSKPKALCLTVFLDPKVFISLEPRYKQTIRDIKIDVYLNGHFFDSELIRYGYATRNSARTKQIVRFTGFRINRVFEKPWILVPSGQDPEGVSAQYYDRGSDAISRRWHAVSDAILVAADRAGRGRDGERSALGEYLESLASLPMQPEVAGVQKPGSADFGVIDVVISWTKGTRADLAETSVGRPMVTIVEGYEYVEPDDLIDVAAQDIASRVPSPDTAPRTPVHVSAGTDLLDDPANDTTTSNGFVAAYPSPTSCARTPPTYMRPSVNIGRSTGRSLLGASSSRKRTRSASISGPESQSKRPRQTLEQEMASIQKKAEEDIKQSNASKADPRSTPSDVRRKHEPITLDESSTDDNLSSGSLSLVEQSTLSTDTEDETDTPRLSARAKQKLPIPPMKLRSPKKKKSPKGKVKEKEVIPETVATPGLRSGSQTASAGRAHDAGFVVPELSRDCIITYAPPGLVRNVGPARKTFMVEEGAVIYGVRWVVG